MQHCEMLGIRRQRRREGGKAKGDGTVVARLRGRDSGGWPRENEVSGVREMGRKVEKTKKKRKEREKYGCGGFI